MKNDKINIEKLRSDVETYYTHNADIIDEANTARDYYDGYQYTSKQLEEFKRRKQIPVVFNKICQKINSIIGLHEQRSTDMKAFPVNRGDDEKAAQALSEALSYVEDNNNFDMLNVKMFEQLMIEGIAIAEIDTTERKKKEEITIERVPYNEFYFDPNSREADFCDVDFIGRAAWMSKEKIAQKFPDFDLKKLSSTDSFNYYDENNIWFMNNEGTMRYRVVKHFFMNNGQWHVIYFSGDNILRPAEVSPYLDDAGDPMHNLVAYSAYIDRFGRRYGEVRKFIDRQNEINQRRSKYLHLLSDKRVIASRDAGISNDIRNIQRELSKPDGIIMVNGNVNESFKELSNIDMGNGQLQMYLDAKSDMDSTSINASLTGSNIEASGKAIAKLQAAAIMEVTGLLKGNVYFKQAIFEKVFAFIKNTWTKEKWVRVTDNEDNVKWVGFNYPVTLQETLESIINNPDVDERARAEAAKIYTERMANNDPMLSQVVEVKNKINELNVDIKIRETSEYINSQQEQMELIMQFAMSSQDMDITDIIELSSLKNKEQIIEKINQRRANASEQQKQMVQAQADKLQVDNAKKFAETQKVTAEAEQKQLENINLAANPDKAPQVGV